MKKIISAVLAFVFCLFLMGCTPANVDGEEGKTKTEEETQKEVSVMYLTIGDNKLRVTLANNAAVDALVELLKNGDIIYTAHDYGGFEKVGSLGHTLPTSDSSITTKAGDVILYQGDQLVLFYGSNTWSYTRIGRIEGYTSAELSEKLGAGGDVQVRISLQ